MRMMNVELKNVMFFVKNAARSVWAFGQKTSLSKFILYAPSLPLQKKVYIFLSWAITRLRRCCIPLQSL